MEKVDLLSRLPEQILDIILCLLPQKEAVRTSVLSKSWRHLGPSRSKLELCRVTDFNGDRENFRLVMYNTIRRYNHHHPLKQLSLNLSSVTRFDLPWVAKKAPLLEELYLNGWNLRNINLSHKRSRPVFNHLRKLSLVGCKFKDQEKLKVLFSSAICPLLEWLCITHIYDFDNLNVGRLKHFEMSQGHSPSIQVDDASMLETIRIADCSKWCFLGNSNYFPSLKSLCLKIVKLSSETFGFFTSKYMPSLEKLELERCYGCEIFRLSNSSIKYLSIIFDRGETKAAIIDAPNLSCFNLKAYHPLPSLSFAPLSSEWKSHVHLTTDNCINTYDRKTPCLGNHEIHRVLESLSGSQIALKLFIGKEYQRRIVDSTAYHGLYKKKPLVVDHLILEFGDYSCSTVRFMFEYLFRVCRPRYIYDVHVQDMSKFLLDEREKMGYSWDRDLLEVSMESSYYDYPKDLLESHDDQTIRYRLKWRGS